MGIFQSQRYYNNIQALKSYKSLTGIINLFLLWALFQSCSDFKQKGQLNKVERIQKSISTLQSTLEEGFPDTLSSMRLNMMQTELKIKNNLILDSVDNSFGADMDAYKMARKSIKSINKQYITIKKTLLKSKIRVDALYSDISQGFGKRNAYEKYIATEHKNTLLIEKRIDELLNEVKQVCDQYRLLHPKLMALSNKWQ